MTNNLQLFEIAAAQHEAIIKRAFVMPLLRAGLSAGKAVVTRPLRAMGVYFGTTETADKAKKGVAAAGSSYQRNMVEQAPSVGPTM